MMLVLCNTHHLSGFTFFNEIMCMNRTTALSWRTAKNKEKSGNFHMNNYEDRNEEGVRPSEKYIHEPIILLSPSSSLPPWADPRCPEDLINHRVHQVRDSIQKSQYCSIFIIMVIGELISEVHYSGIIQY